MYTMHHRTDHPVADHVGFAIPEQPQGRGGHCPRATKFPCKLHRRAFINIWSCWALRMGHVPAGEVVLVSHPTTATSLGISLRPFCTVSIQDRVLYGAVQGQPCESCTPLVRTKSTFKDRTCRDGYLGHEGMEKPIAHVRLFLDEARTITQFADRGKSNVFM